MARPVLLLAAALLCAFAHLARADFEFTAQAEEEPVLTSFEKQAIRDQHAEEVKFLKRVKPIQKKIRDTTWNVGGEELHLDERNLVRKEEDKLLRKLVALEERKRAYWDEMARNEKKNEEAEQKREERAAARSAAEREAFFRAHGYFEDDPPAILARGSKPRFGPLPAAARRMYSLHPKLVAAHENAAAAASFRREQARYELANLERGLDLDEVLEQRMRERERRQQRQLKEEDAAIENSFRRNPE